MTVIAELNLTEAFNEFAAKAVADFPQMEDRFVFYSATTDTLHGSFSEDGEALSERLRKEVKRQMESGKVPSASAARRTDNYFLMINYMSETEVPHEMEVRRILEHELGHLISPGGYRHFSPHFIESVADTFSFIRQQQEYPAHSGSLDLQIFKTALPFALKGEMDSFTTPALQGFKEFSKAHHIPGLDLTPAQTANLAYRLSLQNTLVPQELHKLAEIFGPVKEAYESEGGWRAALKECAKLMLADHGENSHMVFMTGKAFLMPFLDHDMDILGAVFPPEAAENFNLTDAFWDDFREKIKEREEQMNETPEQIRERRAGYLQALGYFDRDQDPDALIDTAEYETSENQAYIKCAREDYLANAGRKPPPSADFLLL